MAGTTTYYGISYPTSTDYVKDGAAAIQTVATGFDSAVAIPTYNAQTGATYTFVLSDTGKTVTASNASSQTYTIPPTASVAWVASTTLNVINLGAGVVTFAAGAGVTVTNTAATLKQYQSAQLVRTALNAWTVVPSDVGASGLTLLNTTTFSAVSSQSINDVFSATYQNYQVVLAGATSSTATGGNITMRFRVSSADDSTAFYAYIGSKSAAAITLLSAVSQTSTIVGAATFNTADNGWGSTLTNIFRPFEAKWTHFLSSSNGVDAAAADALYSLGGSLRTSTSYTGFTLFFPFTSSGTIRVYGYSN